MVRLWIRLVYRAITRRFLRSAIACCGVALGIAALVLLEAIMEGVSDAMVRNTVALHHGHVTAAWSEPEEPDLNALRRRTGVRSVLRRRTCGGLLVRGSAHEGASLCGVDPAAEATETVVAAKVTAGEYLRQPGSVLLGKGLARRLEAGVGDAVEFHRPGRPGMPFTVCGVFRTGVEFLDGSGAFVLLADCPSDGARQELAVFLRPGADARECARELGGFLPVSAEVTPWQESLAELVQLIALNHVAMNIVQLLALVVLAFGVSNTAFISVLERTRELGILKAIGVTPAGIRWTVLGEILLLVALAGVLGELGGFGLAGLARIGGLDLSRWTSENPHFIASGVIYPRLTLRAMLLPIAVAMACGLTAALLPALRAGRMTVTEALRNG
jgi:ABC-type lipoprotein release transport system permease subunit